MKIGLNQSSNGTKTKKIIMYIIIGILIISVITLGVMLYRNREEYKQASENTYNMAFF